MAAEGEGSIRALVRGLAVLRAINHSGSATLIEIANAADIPHPTAIRIVRTLVDLGFVEREPTRKHYRPTALVEALSCGFQRHDRLVRTAREPIVALTGEIGWPLSIVTRVGGQMVSRDSTVSLTSLTFNLYQPGVTLPIFGSASGEAWFAFSHPAEQAEILAHAEASGVDPALISDFRSGEATRQIVGRGYAVGTRNPRPEGSGGNVSISVPILVSGRIVGALTLVFFAQAMTVSVAVERFLAQMKRTAATIGTRLESDSTE